MAVSRFAAINAGSYELMLKIYEISAGKKVRILDNVRYVMEKPIRRRKSVLKPLKRCVIFWRNSRKYWKNIR